MFFAVFKHTPYLIGFSVLGVVADVIFVHTNSLWWTGRESNPRPEHILLRFIQRYYYYTTYCGICLGR